MTLLSHKELAEIIETVPVENQLYVLAENLVTAMNDWPTINLKEPTDLIKVLHDEIKENLTYENLAKYAASLQVEKDAWKIESVSSLIEMFDKGGMNRTLGLEAIIEKIQRDHALIKTSH